MFWWNPPAKCCIYIVINLFPCLGSQVVGDRIILEIEFGPDDKVYNFLVDTIGPVIIKYFDILYPPVLITDLRSKNYGGKQPYRDR